ncbi:MAG TPA: transglutaminase-like domain-containing protein [Polyangiaceae bacterium]|nr:transglutaminase-like domain-containing protein [Polyangiaceae bacterium]
MEFRDYARTSDERLDLLTGALLIARDAHPGLDFAAQRARIDELARPLDARGLSGLPPSVQARLLSDYLYVVCGFHGAGSDYYDPRNSFVNEVLDRKTGIPITLAVVYIEVARRLGVDALGVGFPGHFLVRLEARGPGAELNEPVIVDPFNQGRLLDADALGQLLRQSNVRVPLSNAMLEPARTRHIVARMLMNLRGIYASRGDAPRLLLTLDRLIDLLPDLSSELLERAQLYEQLGAPGAALADYQRYLDLDPDGADALAAGKAVKRLTRDPDALGN